MSQWELQKIEIKKNLWYRPGDKQEEPQYKGSICFSNGTESFTANIPAERVAAYLGLIADEVVRNATELGKRIAESMTPAQTGEEQL